MTPYALRRERALDAFAGGVVIIPGARTMLRNNDTEYEFRQNSDFFYLTGFEEPGALLVLAPASSSARATLFLQERDRMREAWHGRRLGTKRACAALGVDAAFAIEELDDRLPQLLERAETLYYATGVDAAMDRSIHDALEAARAATRNRGKAPHTITDPGVVLHRMRAIKSPEEIAILRRSAAATAKGHLAAMAATKPGAYEYAVEAVLECAFRQAGAQRLAYESIVAGGDNATVLHYVSNRDVLADGSLLLVDAAAELDYYATDVTRTWPVNGRFSAEQRAVYDIVLAAQHAAMEAVAPGNARNDFNAAAVRKITEGLVELGALTGGVDENIERETYREYYMHGTGHWLGMDVHDVGPYTRDEEPIRFEPGMVTTVEPGLYFRRDANCDERLKGIGVRIEDDVLVTPEGHENLTVMIPKSIAEVEAALQCA
ncbi:MAG TPA: aminopeptidase P N-terminal domain-containing protein [Candidatus Baltobacteraceae bacterium]|nr:aminopeptidase P N-terminal domain-containing protein [Candidatus Baltobacteraceae bacterium]